MNYIVITTPENIEIEYRLAGLGSRLSAAFIDVLIQSSAIAIIYAIVLFGVMNLDFSDLSKLDINGIGPALLIISAFVIYIGYYVCFEFSMNGQTLGKKLFKLRVIRSNGQPITLSHSIVRNILRYFVDVAGVGVICILLNKHHKRVGDMAASTIVVAENPDIDIIHLRSGFEYNMDNVYTDNLYTSPGHKFQQAGLLESLAGAPHTRTGHRSLYPVREYNQFLNDDEYYLLVEFLERRHLFLDSGNDLRRRIVQYLARKFEISEYEITDEELVHLARMNRR